MRRKMLKLTFSNGWYILSVLVGIKVPSSIAEVCTYTNANSPVSRDCVYGCCGEGANTVCCDAPTWTWYTIVGVVFGSVVAIAVLVAIVICLCACCKKKNKTRVQSVPRSTAVHIHQPYHIEPKEQNYSRFHRGYATSHPTDSGFLPPYPYPYAPPPKYEDIAKSTSGSK